MNSSTKCDAASIFPWQRNPQTHKQTATLIIGMCGYKLLTVHIVNVQTTATVATAARHGGLNYSEINADRLP